MNKIGIIGNAGNGSQIGGQITKTVELVHYFDKKNFDYKFVNVRGISPVKLLLEINYLFKACDRVIIILASTGYFKILPLVVYLAKKYSTQIYEIVIGGIRQEYVIKYPWRFNLEKKIYKIYVESTYMEKKYHEMGFEQATYLPNYKSFEIVENIVENREDELHLCTFSRIDEYKGIDTAIDVVSKINKGETAKVILDIYGPIKESYKAQITKKIKEAELYGVTYKGVVSTEQAQEVLKAYDLLLFPTHWITEGFPGTFIDALSAGLPIISSKRPNFTDIVDKGYNGYLVDEYDIDTFSAIISDLYHDRDKLIQMKKNAVRSSAKYRTDNVLVKLIEES
ncbi:MAG: glycosyltransferase family 4 protein [Lachnospiraceae bacterium]|nr:glycosyltransferase family 4 protein [Lachnospiraceae bacterium]